MCGIAGRFNYKTGAPASREELGAMAQRLAHRGPDGEGFHLDGPLGFAHRRLAIIDLSTGDQPMATSDGATFIVFNGEIYNYLELFDDLRARGRIPRTRSDTEAILLAYEEWGLDFPERLNGMFAVALWDARERRLVLCRDRMGIKPLYFAETKDGVVFASEVKALRAAAGVDTTLDREALDDFMTLGYVVQPRSLLSGVRKLEPGTLMTVEPGVGMTRRRYWSLRFQPDPGPSAHAWAEEVRALFDDSVRLQLRSDVPLGVLLSGGVDSTAVAATLAHRKDVTAVDTFCIGVDVPGGETEFAWARRVANELGTRHHEKRLTADEHTALLVDAAFHLDEPLAEPMCAQLLGVCRLARRHVKVVLSGEGADETFFGYSAYRVMYAIELAQRLVPGAALEKVVGPALTRLAGVIPGAARLTKFLRAAAEPLERRYLGLSFFDTTVKEGLYRPEIRRSLAGRDARETMRRLYDGAGGPEAISQMAAVDCRGWLVDNTLLRSDVMSMAASIELRVPFLDHRLVELAARIPARFKVHPHDQKVVLKRALADRIPRDVLRRRKVGFPTPIVALMRGDFGRDAERLLTGPGAATAGLFDPAAVRRLFDEHRAGNNYARVLWQLTTLEHWSRAIAGRTAVEDVAAPRAAP
jgi:asparagine synthase (glutamine-hydrolysing)